MCIRDSHDVVSQEVYFEPGAPALAPADDDDEEAEDLFVIGERDTIDIETQLRDAIVPLVDPRPLCSDDCAGLCDCLLYTSGRTAIRGRTRRRRWLRSLQRWTPWSRAPTCAWLSKLAWRRLSAGVSGTVVSRWARCLRRGPGP